MRESFWKNIWDEHRGTSVGTCFGFLLGILYLIVGFWHTLMFALFICGGFYIGRRADRKEDLRAVLERLFPDKFFRR